MTLCALSMAKGMKVKMTTRERNLVLIIVPVIVAIVVYSLFFGVFAPSAPTDLGGKATIDFDNANQLLRSKRNILKRNQIITARLNKLKVMFYPKTKPDDAEIALLKETETIAAACNLNVEQKNMMRYSETLIGVTLNGKTTSESLFKFMQQTTESRMGMQISRLQVHAFPDQKQIDYQIAVSSLLL